MDENEIKEQQTSKANIQLKIEGPAFKEGVPLLEITTALQEFHYILDKSYLAQAKLPKMSHKEREIFKVIATEIRQGSFIADLQLVLFLSSPFLPTIYGYKAKDLWEIAKNVHNYLKTLFSMRSTGIEPKIKIEGDNYAPIIDNEGGTITINNIVFNAADRAESHFKKLTSVIKEGKTDSISVVDEKNEGFILTPKERDLFNPSTQLEKEVITIQVDIFRYDKESSTGKLRVLEGQAIPPGEYSFQPIGKFDPIQYIISMTKPTVTVNVLKEIEKHASGVIRVSRLHIISIEKMGQGELFKDES